MFILYKTIFVRLWLTIGKHPEGSEKGDCLGHGGVLLHAVLLPRAACLKHRSGHWLVWSLLSPVFATITLLALLSGIIRRISPDTDTPCYANFLSTPQHATRNWFSYAELSANSVHVTGGNWLSNGAKCGSHFRKKLSLSTVEGTDLAILK